MAKPGESSIVLKCNRIIDALTNARKPLAFSEIVEETGFVKSSCHRILAILQNEELVAYDKESRTYSVGARFLQWARSAWVRQDLHEASGELASRLSEQTGMNVAMSVLDGDTLLYLRTYDQIPVRYAARPGDHAPLHCTAAGKVFLAFMNEKRRDAMFGDKPLEKFTEFTHTDYETLKEDFTQIRRQGYAVAIREEFLQILGIAAPVWNSDQQVITCMSIWGPTAEISEEQLLAQVPLLKQSTRKLSALHI